MKLDTTHSFDVAVIGGGPAGMSACLELSRMSDLNIALFESEPDLGGIPRSCHLFFGMRDLKRIYSGPTYARKLLRSIQKTCVKIYTRSTVRNISVGDTKRPHQLEVASPQGVMNYDSRFIVISTGCFESSRQTRFIPGTRPTGIFTTGTLQQILTIRNQKPGTRALIIGSEHVALSTVLELKQAGVSIAGMIEKDPLLQTYELPARAMSAYFQFPIYKSVSLKSIQGDERVEGVEIINDKNQKSSHIACDTIILTGKFRPDSQLIDNTSIQRDPLTEGPLVDMDLMTSVPNIFAAGNVLRGAAMHDLCALEGKKVARNILTRIVSTESQGGEGITLRVEHPIRYVVPQKIVPLKIVPRRFPWLHPGYSIQMENTIIKPVIEAWSGNKKIWDHQYRKMIARTSYSLPVEKFNWKQLVPKKGVILKLK